ncbi:DUF6603 domain-containing protein [Clostridium transplantifaecale]|uniref:DUF6603 domain-containing protein n=1 Tax=Clostridium transplantifaecale TaxID=2479838 RepID=UPI000F632F4E|nr:DUF6603 domain-containing protein [Clostridium transplantifaecale]
MEERNRGKTLAGQAVSRAVNLQILAGADITIGSLPFRLLYQYGGADSALRAEWTSGGGEEELQLDGLSDVFTDSPVGFGVPDTMEQFDLRLTAVSLTYFFKRSGFCFRMEASSYGSFQIETEKKEAGTALAFALELQARFYFRELPALGSGANQEDFISLRRFTVELMPDKTVKIKALAELQLLKSRIEIPVSMEKKMPAAMGEGAAMGDEPSVHWLDVGKDAGPLHLSRLGFSMDEGSAAVFVDAGVRLSVLMLEFMGLSLSLPFKAGKTVDYGLSGIAVTVSKPPLSISGGLYLSGSREERIYSGQVMVRFQDVGLTALCSYGELAGGKPSLFAWLLLEASIGGPPAFFVTGIAGGFGYNRTIRLPSRVQDAGKFPFVAAAMGKGDLKASMTPAQVLVAMNEYIKPQNNQYFLSVGIRFTSFGIVESFALVNLEFGDRFELSFLGISKLSMPAGSGTPMAYIELAIKAVLAPDDGLFSVEGALSSSSYLLSRDCRPQGGFAFFLWYGENEHAGDFVITLGGYRSGFFVSHYPKADRIGVNWKMSNELTLAAEFYFALIPSGVMMGGNLGLTYEWKRLKAWLRVWAEFFMQWEPFLYEISVGVSVGASYRWDFFPFYKTFTVELGAALDLWGPPFGGRAHISWFVISFTIKFGEGRPSPGVIGWDIFVDQFLKENKEEPLVDSGSKEAAGRRLISIKAAKGSLGVRKIGGCLLMDSDHMQFEITSKMLCTGVRFRDSVLAETRDLGILPMGISTMDSVLEVRLAPEPGLDHGLRRREELDSVEAWALFENVPRAIWDVKKPLPDDTETLKQKVPAGMVLTCKEKEPEGVLPDNGIEFYDMEILCRNEHLTPHSYEFLNPDPVDPKEYPGENRLKQIEESIGVLGGQRKQILDELGEFFGICREEEIHISGWVSSLDEMMYSEPVLGRIGAKEICREECG